MSRSLPICIARRQSMQLLPPILKVNVPKTPLQRAVIWLGRKSGLIAHYRPELPVTLTETLDIPENFIDGISAAISGHLYADHRLDPQRDLVVLVGQEAWAEFIYETSIRAVWNVSVDDFHRPARYQGIPVVLVGYMHGWFVARRSDLQEQVP